MLLVSGEGPFHQQSQRPVLLVRYRERVFRQGVSLVVWAVLQVEANQDHHDHHVQTRYHQGSQEEPICPPIVTLIGTNGKIASTIPGSAIDEISEVDAVSQKEDVDDEFRVDQDIHKGNGGGLREVLPDDGLDSSIGDHKPCDIDDSVHDFCGLEVDVDTHEGQQPDRNEDGHHVHHGVPEQRDLKHHILEWFEVHLRRLVVLKHIFVQGIDLLRTFELSLVMSVPLHLGLHHIIGSKGFLTRVGQHRGHLQHSLVFIHFVHKGFLNPQKVEADLLDTINFPILHVFLLLLDVVLVIVFELIGIHMLDRNDEFEVDEAKWSQEVVKQLRLNYFQAELFPESVENSNSFNACPSLPIFYFGFEGLNLELLTPGCGHFNVPVFVEKKGHVVAGLSLHLFATVDLQGLAFLRVEVQPIHQKGLEILVPGKDQKVNAQYSIDRSLKILKVDLCEVTNFELDAGRYEDLTIPFSDLHYFETVFQDSIGSQLLLNIFFLPFKKFDHYFQLINRKQGKTSINELSLSVLIDEGHLFPSAEHLQHLLKLHSVVYWNTLLQLEAKLNCYIHALFQLEALAHVLAQQLLRNIVLLELATFHKLASILPDSFPPKHLPLKLAVVRRVLFCAGRVLKFRWHRFVFFLFFDELQCLLSKKVFDKGQFFSKLGGLFLFLKQQVAGVSAPKTVTLNVLFVNHEAHVRFLVFWPFGAVLLGNYRKGIVEYSVPAVLVFLLDAPHCLKAHPPVVPAQVLLQLLHQKLTFRKLPDLRIALLQHPELGLFSVSDYQLGAHLYEHEVHTHAIAMLDRFFTMFLREYLPDACDTFVFGGPFGGLEASLEEVSLKGSDGSGKETDDLADGDDSILGGHLPNDVGLVLVLLTPEGHHLTVLVRLLLKTGPVLLQLPQLKKIVVDHFQFL